MISRVDHVFWPQDNGATYTVTVTITRAFDIRILI